MNVTVEYEPTTYNERDPETGEIIRIHDHGEWVVYVNGHPARPTYLTEGEANAVADWYRDLLTPENPTQTPGLQRLG